MSKAAAAAYASAEKPPAAAGAVRWQDIPSWADALAADAKAKGKAAAPAAAAGAAAAEAKAKPTEGKGAAAAQQTGASAAAAAGADAAAGAGAGAGAPLPSPSAAGVAAANAAAAAASAASPAPPGGPKSAAEGQGPGAGAGAAPTNDELNAKVCVWRGDITRLAVDAIMNAANEPLGGCSIPGHCIDSAICLAAGPELVEASSALGPIDAGECVITKGFRLRCPWVVHVVGPRCGLAGTRHRFDPATRSYVPVGPVMPAERPVELRHGYTASLDLCRANGVRSFALCCLSTGMFGYAKEPAGHVALQAVRDWLSDAANFAAVDRIVFCTFDAGNTALYHQLMPLYFPPNGTAAARDTAHLSPDAIAHAEAIKKAPKFF